MIVVSTGCPAGIGPEVSIAAAARLKDVPKVLVGDERTLFEAAELVGVPSRRLRRLEDSRVDPRFIYILPAGPRLTPTDRKPGKPSKRAGAAQLMYIDVAYDLVRTGKGRALVTGPVSKQCIARSGHVDAEHFRGHTEWLQARDGAASSVMCFASEKLVTSVVTTHIPLADVPARLEAANVRGATLALAELLLKLGRKNPLVAVCSLNPHAGEGELFGTEERRAIVPGLRSAARTLRRRCRVEGPVGAETAYRKAAAGHYQGVVAMYHDQATIPMKLIAFGEAVNVTMGLSVARTSVDHGTAYDIAWQGVASHDGMLQAMRLGARLA